jgi:hypothetical protein
MTMRAALIQLIRESQTFGLIIGTCESVNEQKLTCTIQPLNGGAKYYKVRLKLEVGFKTGVYSIPEKGSLVLAAQLGNQNNVMVIAVEKPESVVIAGQLVKLNGDDFTLLKGAETLQELNKLKALVEGIRVALTGSPIIPLDGGLTYKTAITAAIASLPSPSFIDLENKTVKHGKGV